LFDEKRRHSAVVQADGTLALGAITGSIHKIGALVQGLPACNGWTFWHRAEGTAAGPIDTVRTAFRARSEVAGGVGGI
jgi:modification methylase